MKINDRMKQVYLQNMNSEKVNPLDKTVKPQTSTKIERDSIQLSNQTKMIKEYTQMAKGYELNSTDVVNRIKNQLAEGTYEISSGKIAEAMIEQFKK